MIIDRKYKFILIISILVCILLSLIGYSILLNQQKKSISNLNSEIVKQKAISLIMSMYLGTEDYITQESQKNAQIIIKEHLKRLSEQKIEKISISSFNKKADNSVVVVIQVYEVPFKTIIFYEMEYTYINNQWLLNNINFNA